MFPFLTSNKLMPAGRHRGSVNELKNSVSYDNDKLIEKYMQMGNSLLRNKFKVINKNARVISLISFWCVCYFEHISDIFHIFQAS